jgi:pyruvate dehydrogenase E2 component (dihydrolipoamide acetyltransferase)
MCSPVARRLASQSNLDLRTVKGTGPRGRIQLADVRRAIENQGARAAGPQPLSPMRRAVARSMTLAVSTIPQFIVSQSVDWTAIQAKRAELTAQLPAGTPKITVNDFLLQAIARTLLTYPALNSTFRGTPDSADAAIVPADGAHIGLVVAVENGLLVPILHDVHQIGLGELARRRTDAVDRALKGRLKQTELEGGTFSLSNLGARGPDRFTAIVSPPQSAILAVGRQRDCVVAINGGIHVRPMSELSLTVDHRVADGRLASEFLRYLVEILEGPEWRA